MKAGTIPAFFFDTFQGGFLAFLQMELRDKESPSRWRIEMFRMKDSRVSNLDTCGMG